ncbi:hypothetical protein UlMin_012824 [Ulmus minor]
MSPPPCKPTPLPINLARPPPPTTKEHTEVHTIRNGKSTIRSSEPVIHDGYENVTNDMFDSKNDLQTRLHIKMMRTNYQFKVYKSNTSFLVVRCMDNNFLWRIRAIEHTCTIDYKRDDHRHATSWVIDECLKNRYISSSRSFKPKDIVQDVREKFGVQISYDKAWRAREAAYATLRGTSEESYTFLPSFIHILKEKNPSTVTNIVLTNESRFKYFFMVLAASVQGYLYCRSDVCVDGAHLKGKYKGMMFTVVCKDGNNNIFP